MVWSWMSHRTFLAPFICQSFSILFLHEAINSLSKHSLFFASVVIVTLLLCFLYLVLESYYAHSFILNGKRLVAFFKSCYNLLLFFPNVKFRVLWTLKFDYLLYFDAWVDLLFTILVSHLTRLWVQFTVTSGNMILRTYVSIFPLC